MNFSLNLQFRISQILKVKRIRLALSVREPLCFSFRLEFKEPFANSDKIISEIKSCQKPDTGTQRAERSAISYFEGFENESG